MQVCQPYKSDKYQYFINRSGANQLSKSSKVKKVLTKNVSEKGTPIAAASEEQKICFPIPKIETQKVCLNLPKIEIVKEKVCFDLPKIPSKACDCPPPEMRCPRQGKVTTRAVIPKSAIAFSIGGPLTVDEIEIGEVSIPNLSLKDFGGAFTYDSCKAKNVELEVTLSINTSFSGDIDLGCLGSYGVSGGVNFDSYVEKHNLGTIVFNSGSFSMKSPSTAIGPFSMAPQPIRETKINQVTAENIAMKCTTIPLDNPVDISLGICLPIPNPMGPTNLATDETHMAQMSSTGIQSSQATMKNITALNISMPSVTTQGFVAQSSTALPTVSTSQRVDGSTTGVHRYGDAEKAEITVNLDLNITSVKMNVIDGLEFTNVKGNVTTASAVGDKLDLNLVLKGIKIKGLNICGMKIPEIEVVM
jgi:hypothetical protein